MSFERIVEIEPAFDRRAEGYGIHCAQMRFVLKGPLGAVQFLLFTQWQLPHVAKETYERTVAKALAGEDIGVDLRCFYAPMPADRGYHSPVPLYEGQQPQPDCPYLDGKPCYYDGSGLQAEGVFEALVREGTEGVWKELEYYYHSALETPINERTVEGMELGSLLNALAGDPRRLPFGSPPEKESGE